MVWSLHLLDGDATLGQSVQGDEWGAYITLLRTSETNMGSPTGRESEGDITGARWGLSGAEAVLKLRAVRANGDFDAYWTWHQQQEFIRNHQTRYRDQVIPTA
ncbi:hypothetical protein GCM10010269_82620 [Streptomyces humidus]|uniref:Uncharacterized protein n=1 Tax=Streptomyces humidus TaxID=52259 RepID=A0A918GES2_9ACTN|nr:hypothetical protein GCM10010269_82620 [Streptomyces humidus]